MAECCHEDHEGEIEDVVERSVGGIEVTFCENHDPLSNPTVAAYFEAIDA